MIIRQGLNFAAHLLAGAVLGGLTVLAAQRRKRQEETLEPRYPPPPPQEEPAAETTHPVETNRPPSGN
jgi:hypothetical protein